MASNGEIQGPNGSLEESLHTELESILREQRNRGIVDRERDLNIYRSGSAPPTVEGSLSAVGGLFGANDFRGFGGESNEDDEFRSHPDYLSYYYSHDNVNPRLPPPSLSREDWRVARRFSGGSSSSSSLFSMQPDPMNAPAPRRSQTPQAAASSSSAEWLFERGSDGFAGGGGGGSGLGARRKSFADILQEGTDRHASSPNFLSRPSSRNNFSEEGGLRNGVAPLDLSGIQSQGAAVPYPLSSVAGLSLPRNTTPEPKLVGRSPGSGLPPVGSRVEQKNFRGFNPQSGYSSEMNELADIAANLSGLSLSKFRDRDVNSHGQSKLSLDGNADFLFKSGYGESLQREFIDNSDTDNLSAAFNYTDLARINGAVNNISASKISSNMHANFPRRTSSSANLYSQVGSSGFGSLEGQNAYHQNATTDFRSGSFLANHNQNSAIDSHLETVLTSIQNGHMNNLGNKAGQDLLSPLNDPRYVQFLQRNPDYATRPANSLADLSLVKNQFSTSHGDLEGFQKAYIERLLLAQQREQLELSLLGKSSGYNSIGSYGPSSPYQGNTIGNSVLPNVGSGSPLLQNERISRYSSMMRNSMGRSTGSINSEISNTPEGKITSSILDEFKNNKIRSFELPDIVGHVVEFSMDQYGSRFIQQKLETATAEEKAIIFPEIIPHAHGLMTDVFGNYVIQKFFEHGTESQRKELANQLTGHVLPLSLQMYGCRVIQKALEVVGLDQQTQMVAELDGSIMKCVRDQNGNHVIQKCIECVPQECIQFIITAFYGQVVVLSTHPYGCRVIQRVLEHCDDSNTQQIIMNEIMQSVCTLAQDQYGNYVIQHVLQYGNPQERSTIIYKLAGQIVRMSQQKFASNVVEKCLTFGTPDERQILVNEMLGSTDENEPLQAMMKDPFGNYVVQKVLETCNDESLELLLSRIKVHLNTLKRFTYGKHIVSRIEKLIATGERRIGLSSAISS